MIDSLTDKSKRTIILDRVISVINDNTKEVKLITDKDKIKEIINSHFHSVAGGKHEPRTIPED